MQDYNKTFAIFVKNPCSFKEAEKSNPELLEALGALNTSQLNNLMSHAREKSASLDTRAHKALLPLFGEFMTFLESYETQRIQSPTATATTAEDPSTSPKYISPAVAAYHARQEARKKALEDAAAKPETTSGASATDQTPPPPPTPFEVFAARNGKSSSTKSWSKPGD